MSRVKRRESPRAGRPESASPLNRREFLLRLALSAAALTLARRARAGAGAGDAKPPPGAGTAPDSLSRDDSARSNVALIAAAGDTTLGFNLQAHFDERAASGISRDLLYALYFSGVK